MTLNNYLGKNYFMTGQYNMLNNKYITERKIDDCIIKAKKSYNWADDVYTKALEFYEKYPDQYILELADVMKSLGDLYYNQANTIDDEDKKTKMRNKGCRMLLHSYRLYRMAADLHGIADVMLSFGNAVDFSQNNQEKGKRSSLSFYDMAINLYKQLGDDLSHQLALKSREKAVEEIRKRKLMET